MLEPHVVVHDRGPRRGEKTHLRRELTALLAAAQEFVGERAIEKHDRFTERQTVLRAAQAERIDTGTPRDIGRRAIEGRDCIGKARAVKLDFHSACVRHFAECTELFRRVDGAELRRLRERQRARARAVLIVRRRCECRNGVGDELRVRRLCRQQLGAAAEKLRRAALIDVDMRIRVANDCVGTVTNRREPERVRGRAVEHEKHIAIGVERGADRVGRGACPVVVAVTGCVAAIRFDERSERFRTNASVVVARELRRLRVRRHRRSAIQSRTELSAAGSAAGLVPPACAISARPPPLPPTCCAT